MKNMKEKSNGWDSAFEIKQSIFTSVRCFDSGRNHMKLKVLMAYIIGASRKFKPPTLWSIYSMLKKTILIKQQIDLTKYCRLRAFLKTKSDGYVSKKANVFTPEEVNRFIVEAPNHLYLGMKVP